MVRARGRTRTRVDKIECSVISWAGSAAQVEEEPTEELKELVVGQDELPVARILWNRYSHGWDIVTFGSLLHADPVFGVGK